MDTHKLRNWPQVKITALNWCLHFIRNTFFYCTFNSRTSHICAMAKHMRAFDIVHEELPVSALFILFYRK